MGKTSLLAEVRRRAAEAGVATLSAVGSELEGEYAFGVVRQLFEPAIRALSKRERAGIFEGAAALAEPVLDFSADPAVEGQFSAMHGLYWLGVNLSRERPLLLAVDDAHWADTASLRWLAYLLNRLDGLPILVAIATRPAQSGAQGEVLATVLAHPRPRIVQVGPLGKDSVAALVRSALGARPDPAFTAACLQATAGNPLGLNELLRDLKAREVSPTSDAAVNLDRRAPDAIARRVQKDLGLLGDSAARLASALAVIGDGTELRLIARLAGLEVDRAAEAADDLFAADLIAPERPPRFVHPLLRAAVYDGLPAASRQNLHRRAAEILASNAAEPEVVAAHLLRCEPGRSTDAVKWLRAAAPLALRRGAPATAVSYLTRALAEDVDAPMRSAVLAELGSAEHVAGDHPGAADHLREALTGTTDGHARGAMLCDLAMAVGPPEDIDLLDRAIVELGACDPDAATRLECIATAFSRASSWRLAPSVESHYPRLRELARSRGPNAELARATLAVLLSWRDGNREEALLWVGSGFGWKVHYEARLMHSIGVHWVPMALRGMDKLHEATGFCEAVLRAAGTDGYMIALVISMMHKAEAEFEMGLLADAEADASAALELSPQHLPQFVDGIGATLAQIRFERGQRQAAYEAIEGIGIPPVDLNDETTLRPGFRQIRGRLRCARGWRQDGIEDLRESGRLCDLLLNRNPIIWPWRPSLAAVLAQDCPDEARQVAQENLANALRSAIPRGIGVAFRTLALLDHDDSIDHLRAAVAALGESPAQLDLAKAQADLGGALRRHGHRVEAREPLREALEIAARCGAVPLIERVQAEALAAGARPRRLRLRGVDALTPSELRVARLAAEGRSNPEIAQALFITARTVADHLSSSYSKLGIPSRQQLVAALDWGK